MFINKDMMFSVLQITELQWETYKKFLSLTEGDKVEASRQTQIFMGSMFANFRTENQEE